MGLNVSDQLEEWNLGLRHDGDIVTCLHFMIRLRRISSRKHETKEAASLDYFFFVFLTFRVFVIY